MAKVFRNAIIVGSSGFIGTHLKRYLSAEYPEVNIHSVDVEVGNVDANNHRIDIRKPFKIEGNWGSETIIFNLAAVHRTPGHPDNEYFETNIRGAENVCNFARSNKIDNIVFTSSISPYGVSEELKTETTLPMPNTPYGISKLVAEKIHQEWAAESSERSLSIARPGIVFGKGENGNMTRLYKALAGRKFAYAGRKDTIKAAIYVKDLVRVMVSMALKDDNHFQLYNCCFYPSYTIEQIVTAMKKATGINSPTPYIPRKPLMAVAGILGALGGVGLGICPERVKKLMISTNISGEKLSVKYPLQFSLETALEDWFIDCDKTRLE